VLDDVAVGVGDDHEAQSRVVRLRQRRRSVRERLPGAHRASERLAVVGVVGPAALGGESLQALREHVAIGPVLALDDLELDRLPALAQDAAVLGIVVADAQREVVEEGAEAALPVDQRPVAVEGAGGEAGRVHRRAYTNPVAVLDRIQQDVNTALKAGDRERTGALRLLASELQKAVKEAREAEVDEIAVLQRERKRRLESAEAFRDAGRTDLAESEEREAQVIDEYLPEQMPDDELRRIVQDVVAESGASSQKEMGKVMSAVMPHVKGRADGKRVSAVVREVLTP